MPSSSEGRDQSFSKEEEMNLRQEAIAWVSRLSDRDASIEDRRACEQWQAQSPAHARAFQRISRVWADPKLDSAAEHLAKRESGVVGKPIAVRSKWLRHALAFAACLVLVLVGVMYVDLFTRIQADYQTGVGEGRTVRLPDGSSVTLNTHSAIATEFDGSIRRVRLLKGEAFFKIQQDPDRVFLVESAETSTRAVGTEFIVRNQHGADRVTVIEGVVEVRSHHETDTAARVSAGSMIETEAKRLGVVRTVDVSMASAWLQGLLIVDGVPLAQVIDEIRRYYPGAILLWNKDLGEMRVTGTYKLEDPSKILFHLTKTFPLQSIGLTDRVVILF